MRRHVPLLVSFVILFALPLPAGQHDGPRLKGFVKEISGEQIDYHSFHPYAAAALLTRCQTGRQTISWQTEPLPAGRDAQYATFVWIAGHSSGTSGAERTFRLDINGQPYLTFTTPRGGTTWQWEAEGKDSTHLRFDARGDDAVHDLFGYAYLTLPVRHFPPGKPLTLSVTGDSAGSPDWYMTFSYVLQESVYVQPQPALLRTAAGSKQLVDVVIDHVRPSGSATVSIENHAPVRAGLQLGYNTVQLALDPVDTLTETRVTVVIEGEEPVRRTITRAPVIYREFWLLPHSHNDIGYSDLQADVEKKQIKNLRDAVALFKKTADYPPEARSRWNSEILWAVDRLFATCSEAERQEFIDVVKQGGIGLNALYTNQLTGICRPEELLRLTDFARSLVRKYGVKINDAMITDIPGNTWGTIAALGQAGIRYFSSGPNYVPHFADGGDRIGYYSKAWAEKPFYWISPSGQEKVLFWVAGRGYSWFANWLSGKAGPRTAGNLFAYLRELEAREYPYDMVQLRYTIEGDNGPIDPNLPDFVKSWNEKYASPRLLLATASEMFEEFERRWGDRLPSLVGDLTPYWEDGALSSLHELGLSRRASERLVQAEAANCVLRGKALSTRERDEAWWQVHMFDEHTWGAHNSVNDPDNPFAVSQWNVKQQFALDADKRSRDLLRAALAERTGGGVVDVINTSSWARTDLVVLSSAQSRKGDRVVDAEGDAVPSQRLSTGELAFVAREVPPLGVKRYTVRPGSAVGTSSMQVTETAMKNGLLSLVLDKQTGAISSLKAANEEFVDASVYAGLNQYLYVAGRDPEAPLKSNVTRIEVKESGPLVGLLRVTSRAPGCKSFTQEIRMVDGIARVDILNVLDREKVRSKESVHMAFPLNVSGGEFRLDGGWGMVRPEYDQLVGSCKDYFPAGRWLDLSNERHGITWTTIESPLVEIGALTDETIVHRGRRGWRTELAPGTTFFSYAMNNYWHTNYKADQEGSATLQYSLFPHAAFSPTAAYRRGVEHSQPLLVRVTESSDPLAASLLEVSVPEIAVTSIRRSDDGKAVMVRFYNTGAQPVSFSIAWKGLRPERVYVSSLAETAETAAPAMFSLPPFGILTLRCE